MESKDLITYKWEGGVYSLEDMVILTKYKRLTPQQFFEITRFDYVTALQNYEKSK